MPATATATPTTPTIRTPVNDRTRVLARTAPGLRAAVLAALVLAFLPALAAGRDARPANPSAAPAEAAAEDWHGNVRRSTWRP
jgi:hypothetical protein